MYRLAKDLGRTVEEILQITHAEFLGWAVFYKMEQSAMADANKRK